MIFGMNIVGNHQLHRSAAAHLGFTVEGEVAGGVADGRERLAAAHSPDLSEPC